MRKTKPLPENVLPLPRLPWPDLKLLEALGPDAARERMETFFAASEKRREENEEHFQRALKKMMRCALLHGMLDPFGSGAPKKHFSWCPHHAWTKELSQAPIFVRDNAHA